MSEYSSVQKGSLKLKGVSVGGVKKKKKKKDKEKTKRSLEQVNFSTNEVTGDEMMEKHTRRDNRTKAQIAFDQIQEKRAVEQIMKKASKSHKERIIDFNKHLDSLTEHFDIPKVSWTK